MSGDIVVRGVSLGQSFGTLASSGLSEAIQWLARTSRHPARK